MARLHSHQYGKTRVRLTQVLRRGARHELTELSVTILCEGDFDSAFTAADNSGVLPTDTMKNTVYVIARQKPVLSPEQFGRDLAAHFLSRVPQIERVKVELQQAPWSHIPGHGAAFLSSGAERRIARLSVTRSGEEITAGLQGLEILKTSDSAFSGYPRDEYTTLPETRDRLLGTVLDADWTYATPPVDFNAAFESVRAQLLETFAGHVSESVQHTLFAMGEATLKAHPGLGEIHLVMPNKHRLLFDLQRFGLDNPNQIFVATDEPSGYIEARVVPG